MTASKKSTPKKSNAYSAACARANEQFSQHLEDQRTAAARAVDVEQPPPPTDPPDAPQ